MAAKKSAKADESVPSQHVLKKRARLRQDILAQARHLLQEGGVEAVTLAALAAQLGLTKQALYHYFPSKEALMGGLVTELLDEEIRTLINAVEKVGPGKGVLGLMIEAFHRHYSKHLEAFRLVYCQTQLAPVTMLGMNEKVLREEINPRTRHLFDVLEEKLGRPGDRVLDRKRKRQLAFSAWLAALGLMTMLGVSEAARDPLIHSDRELLNTLKRTFDTAAG